MERRVGHGGQTERRAQSRRRNSGLPARRSGCAQAGDPARGPQDRRGRPEAHLVLAQEAAEQFYRRNNFGWAWADIEGLEKKEYFAHSGIQSLEGFSKTVARRLKDMSFSPEKGKGKFQTLFVDYLGNVDGPDALPRWFDTEYKMLEDIAARLPDTAVHGKIRLYTNLAPCPSCRGVMDQFLALYTNVDLEVFYEWPP